MEEAHVETLERNTWVRDKVGRFSLAETMAAVNLILHLNFFFSFVPDLPNPFLAIPQHSCFRPTLFGWALAHEGIDNLGGFIEKVLLGMSFLLSLSAH